jgi:hypothetical protein
LVRDLSDVICFLSTGADFELGRNEER